jgi:site-specific DNA recombinase
MTNNIQKQKLIVGAYFRVSTGRQENEATIESQIDEVKKRIEEDGNILPQENIFIDDGWSGEMLARPSLDKMRDAARELKFTALYVYDRGRLSRTFAHQEIVIEELQDKEISFISMHDAKADTPEERVLQAMQGVFHQYERIKIAERMRRGKLFKAKNGVLINGQALYGYNYIKKNDNLSALYEVSPEESRVVNLIWNWYGNENLSMQEIIKRLYDLGISPKKQKSAFWTKGPIVRLLKCETYVTGVAYYNKSESVVAKHPLKLEKYKKVKKTSRKERPREDWIPITVPTIVNDLVLHEKILKRLDFNKRYFNKRRKYDYLLSGLIYCECGNRRSGDGSSKYGHFYYRCIDRIRSFPYEQRCKSPGVNAALLDGLIWNELQKRLKNPSILKEYAVKWVKSLSKICKEDEVEQNRLSSSMFSLEEEEKRYAKAYGTGMLDFEQFKELIKDVKKRKTTISKQIAVLATKNTELQIEIEVDQLVEEALNIIQNMDFTNKFKLIRDIIDKVVIKERSGVEIWAHLPITNINTEKLGYGTEHRYRRSSKCW